MKLKVRRVPWMKFPMALKAGNGRRSEGQPLQARRQEDALCAGSHDPSRMKPAWTKPEPEPKPKTSPICMGAFFKPVHTGNSGTVHPFKPLRPAAHGMNSIFQTFICLGMAPSIKQNQFKTTENSPKTMQNQQTLVKHRLKTS